jgi:lipid II:glycine glycyltransferase (peptidoglycan interpeptide bridge formation enzyme)
MEVASRFTGRRGVSLPFSDFCDALLFDEDTQGFVVAELSQLARQARWKFFELRGSTLHQASASPSAVFYGHEIDLSLGAEPLFARFADSVRRAIRKASKSGIVAEVSRSREALTIFYQLHLRTRRRHGLPPQPFKFFLNIQKELIENDLGFVILARAASRPIAAAVFFQSGKKALYKYAASDERYQQFRGNDLVLWQGIKFLTQGETRTLHLGRTSFENGGLRKFKLGWAVTEQILHYFRFDVTANSWLNSTGLPGPLHKEVFGRLPLKLNQLAGAMIYPHLD